MAGFWTGAAVCAALLAVPGTATATDPTVAERRACAGQVTRSSLVACALAASPDLHVEREAAGILAGRRQSAGTLLPSNPVLALTGARRSSPGTDRGAVFNWSASLSQEIELAGQRSSRVRAADAEQQAQRLRLLTVLPS